MDNYARCAKAFYESLLIAWKSETAMEAVFSRCRRGPTFDRTDHGRAVVQRLFQDAWEALNAGVEPTAYDRMRVLREVTSLTGDFNLITQVAPNLMDLYLQVDVPALEKMKTSLMQRFEGLGDTIHNPFSGKRAKVKVSSETHSPELVSLYTYATGIQKASTILPTMDAAGMSHRITPFGGTPNFRDNCNFCQLPAAGDSYVQPHPDWPLGRDNITGFFIINETCQQTYETMDDGTFKFPSLPEGYDTFASKSGGIMLFQALNARAVAGTLWSVWAEVEDGRRPWMIIPRVYSIQVFAPKDAIPSMEAATGLPFSATRSWSVGEGMRAL